MRVMDYVRVILRRWWLIALLVIVAAGSAYVLSIRQTPVYRATQLVLLQPSRSDFGLTEASRSLLPSSVIYLDSSLRAAEIIEDLQLPMTPEQLMRSVNFAPDNLRMVVQIDVDLTDPEIASRVAQRWGQALVTFREQRNALNLSEDRVLALLPDVPETRQIAPQPIINALAGVILGLLLGLVVVFVLEFIESTVVRRRDDLERVMAMPVLASIPGYDGD
jgi:capsular polysaccharide biosynthesis protein